MMEIKIFGPGCQKCKVLFNRVSELIAEEALGINVVKVEDYEQILDAGVTATPALAIDDVIVVSGRVPTKGAIQEFISESS